MASYVNLCLQLWTSTSNHIDAHEVLYTVYDFDLRFLFRPPFLDLFLPFVFILPGLAFISIASSSTLSVLSLVLLFFLSRFFSLPPFPRLEPQIQIRRSEIICHNVTILRGTGNVSFLTLLIFSLLFELIQIQMCRNKRIDCVHVLYFLLTLLLKRHLLWFCNDNVI